MAMTSTLVGRTNDGRGIWRHHETGGANAILNATKTPGVASRVISVHCKYSAVPTQAGVTSNLDSGAGSAYDVILATSAANAQNSSQLFNGSVCLGDDDGILVTAPAGGVGITAAVTIYTEDQRPK